MTNKEKLLELSKIANEKAVIFEKIRLEFEYPSDGFQNYSLMDYNNAHKAHADAVNNHGALIKKIIDNEYSLNDDYLS